MLADLERLIDLQQVDLRLQELTRQIQLFPEQRAQTEQQLTDARHAIEAARQRHTDSLTERKKLELDVQQLEEKISKHKAQLMEVKSNDAYRALQQEIEHDEQRKASAEDRELEAMLAADEQEQEVKAAEAQLKQAEQRVTAELKRLDTEQRTREQEAAELSARRDALRPQVSDDSLDVYDRIAGAHGGIALAEVREEICQVCLIHIRPQTFAEIRRNDHMCYCESCRRILYYVPPPAPVAPPVEANSAGGGGD